MFDDEDYDDYFLDDNEEGDTSRQTQDYERRTPTAGETINFGSSTTAGSHDDRSHETKSTGRKRSGCGCIIVIVLVIAAAIGYFRYFSPAVDDAVMDVCVVNVEKRGLLFKTYEAEVVDPQRISDQESPYTRPQAVTIADEALARRLQQIQSSGRPVRLRYRRYSATLPWRGESKIVITALE